MPAKSEGIHMGAAAAAAGELGRATLDERCGGGVATYTAPDMVANGMSFGEIKAVEMVRREKVMV